MLANGITLGFNKTAKGQSYTLLPTLKTVPDLGVSPNPVENTPINAKSLRYEMGAGDPGSLEYAFAMDENKSGSDTRQLIEICDAGKSVFWEQTYPDGMKVKYSGTPSYTISGGSINDPLELKLTIAINSDLEVTPASGV
ncbi:hypothetical protein ABGF48_03270 [Helcococcus bovis]|uniref:hypothetical protein n=1 Tax=Helcococcus bovis TaxID=3153252 RepID=UPI0038BA0E0A